MDLMRNSNFWIIISLSALLIAILTVTSEFSFFVLIAILLFFLLVFFIKFPVVGIYLIALLYPFNFFEFVYGQINVPYVDLIGLLLFLAWLSHLILDRISHKKYFSLKDFPLAFFMALFLGACGLSLFNVPSEWFYLSVKYILRPVLFFYLIYVVLPYNLIDSFKKLFNTFKVCFVLGLGLSFMGVWTLIFPPLAGLRRAIPTAILGVYPLGVNHNSIAEILIGIIPLALILFWYEKNVFWKNIYLLGALFMASINMLTLSRSGWLAIGLEFFILIILQYRSKIKSIFTSYLPYLILILVSPMIFLMYQLATSVAMTTSNLNRLKLIEIALKLFKDHWLFGSGIGTFTLNLANVQWYIIEFWDILDAHGLLFKTLAETGLFGTVAFLLLLSAILYLAIKGYHQSSKTTYYWLMLGMLLVVVGSISFQFFSTSYYLAKFWFPLGLTLTSYRLFKLNYVRQN